MYFDFITILLRKSRHWPLIMWVNLSGLLAGFCTMLIIMLLWINNAAMTTLPNSDLHYLLPLSLVYFFILIIYSNILNTLLRSHVREVRIRLALGANRFSIYWHLLLESTMLVLGLVLFAMVITEFILQIQNNILQHDISLSKQPPAIQALMAFGLTLAISIYGALYPIGVFVKKINPGIQRRHD